MLSAKEYADKKREIMDAEIQEELKKIEDKLNKNLSIKCDYVKIDKISNMAIDKLKSLGYRVEEKWTSDQRGERYMECYKITW